MRKQIKQLIIVGLVVYLSGCGVSQAKEVVKKDNEPIELLIKEEENSIVTLSAIGDILIHDRVYNASSIGDKEYDFSEAFKLVKDDLSKSDITVANAETIIGGVEHGLSGYPQFNSPIEIGETLKDVGVDLVTLANNHIFDRGEEVLESALQNWDNLSMPFVGAYRNLTEKERIYVVNINNIKLAFLSYTYGTNGMQLPLTSNLGTNLLEEENIKNDIIKAKEVADVVIVSPHYGQEYLPLPNKEQQNWAQFLADEGVDIIIGTHPHVLQPPAFLTGKNGNETYVMYSLGNFYSGQRGIERQIGGIFSITISKDNEDKIQLESPEVLLTCVSSKDDQYFTIHPLKDTPLDFLPNRDFVYEEARKQLQLYTPLHIK